MYLILLGLRNLPRMLLRLVAEDPENFTISWEKINEFNVILKFLLFTKLFERVR